MKESFDMKAIGLIGGMSWESTIEYYRIINQEVNKRLGGLHSAKIFLESYDFSEIAALYNQQEFYKLTKIVSKTAKKLEAQGADFIAITSNAMHILAEDVKKEINVPLLHIADAAAKVIKNHNNQCVLLLGTKSTMNEPFYKNKLKNDYSIDVVLPDELEQECVHNIIFDELCKGIIKESSREKLNDIIDNCTQKGAQSVVLGCTELPNIVKTASIPIINTLESHCLDIVDKMLCV